MEIFFEQINPHACKTYIFGKMDSNDVIIVDPVLDHLEDYKRVIEERNLNLTHILETHTHADHISGASSLRDITDAELVMHNKAPAKCVTIRVDDGDSIDVGGINIKVILTPGHTRDSVSYVVEDKLLTGDALFLEDGGAGRDDLPGGDPEAHWESLQKLMELPENLIVYPAHDYRDRKPSSLKHQKTTNPHLKPRSKEEFVNFINDLKLGPADWMKDVLKANYTCARDINAAWIPVDSPACEVKGTLDIGVNEQEVDSISPVDLEKRIKGSNSYLLLDVREPFELSGPLGHITGTKNIPISKLILNLRELEDYKENEIFIICRSGGRAHTAAQIMKQSGFKRPIVLEGGMIYWNAQNKK